MQSQGHDGRTASNGGNSTLLRKSFLVVKQEKGVVRFVFGVRISGQMATGSERWEAEIRRTSTKIMTVETKEREWMLVVFRK